MSRIMTLTRGPRCVPAVLVLALLGQAAAADDLAPKPDERQLPHAMHSEMSERPTITVGRAGCDLIGADNRVLQAAVDYVAGLGGGVVEIGEGEYLMRDSLHLRSDVTVRGRKGKTVLRKADGVTSPLAHRRRFRRAADHGRRPDGLHGRAPASRSGTTTRAASTPPWPGSPGAGATPSRSTRRSGPTAWSPTTPRRPPSSPSSAARTSRGRGSKTSSSRERRRPTRP